MRREKKTSRDYQNQTFESQKEQFNVHNLNKKINLCKSMFFDTPFTCHTVEWHNVLLSLSFWPFSIEYVLAECVCVCGFIFHHLCSPFRRHQTVPATYRPHRSPVSDNTHKRYTLLKYNNSNCKRHRIPTATVPSIRRCAWTWRKSGWESRSESSWLYPIHIYGTRVERRTSVSRVRVCDVICAQHVPSRYKCAPL